jgi:hypothetical protein
MTTYRILWKSEDFQICIAAASIALLHAAVLVSVHYGPSQNILNQSDNSIEKTVQSYDVRTTIISEQSLYKLYSDDILLPCRH